MDIASKILGGEGGNRLYRVLRSERGLTYGAAATLVALKDSGHVVADTDTRSSSTAEALRLLVDEISRLQRQRVSSRELEDAQAYLTGSFPLTIETPGAIALQVLNAVFYGLDLKDLETYRERVNAISPDEIQRVAKQYLHPDRLAIVLVGDASVFAKDLAGVGFDNIERIPIGELDLAAADLRRGGPPQGGRIRPIAYQVPATPPAASRTGGDEVRTVIEKALEAKGGRAKLSAVRTLKAVATTTALDAPGGPVAFETTTSIRYPGGFRVDAATAAGPVIQVFNAGDAWVQDKQHGVRKAPWAFAEELRAHVQRDSIPLLLGLADGRVSARRVTGTAAGRQPAIEVHAPGMRPVTIVFDPETALIATVRYTSPAPGSVTTEESYSDYRDVSGIKVAFKATVSRNGVPVIERVLRGIEFNVPLDSALFTRPS
jgi:hypothetical protein